MKTKIETSALDLLSAITFRDSFSILFVFFINHFRFYFVLVFCENENVLVTILNENSTGPTPDLVFMYNQVVEPVVKFTSSGRTWTQMASLHLKFTDVLACQILPWANSMLSRSNRGSVCKQGSVYTDHSLILSFCTVWRHEPSASQTVINSNHFS